MSRQSDAKRSRRRGRRDGRETRWLPDEVVAAVGGAELERHADQLASAAEQFDAWITSRGWTFDADNSAEGLSSWFYEPSAVSVDDDAEPVTRVWFTLIGADDDFPLAVSAVLVGTGADGAGLYRISPQRLVDGIEVFEAYRSGGSRPDLP